MWIILIFGPLRWIVHNVLAGGVQFPFVADDMFVVVALPNPALKGHPTKLLDATDVFIGGHGFEPLHNPW